MANNVIFVFKAIDQYTRVGKLIASATKDIKTQMDSARSSIKSMGPMLQGLATKLQSTGKMLSDFGKAMSMKVSAPLVALGALSIKQAANYETLAVSFRTLIGDAAVANQVLADLVAFANTTPFELDELTTAGKQLLAFNVKANDVIPTLKMLGELSAATGKPIEEFSLIYGKVLAKGKMQGEEMMQLAEKGISIQTMLAQKYGVSGEVIAKAVSDGKISFETFNKVLQEATGKGGRFNGLTENLAGTMNGLGSTLKDSVAAGFREVGNAMIEHGDLKEVMRDLIAGVTSLTASMVAFTKAHPQLTKLIMLFGVILVVLGPVIVVVGQLVIGFASLSAAAVTLGTTVGALVAPFFIIMGVFVLVTAAAVLMYTRWDGIVGGFNALIADIPVFFKLAFDAVVHILKMALAEGVKFSKSMADAVLGVFGLSVDGVINSVTDLFNQFMAFKDKIFGQLEEFKQRIVNFVSGISEKISAVFNISGDISAKNVSRTDVNVNLKAPEGVIKSTKAKTTGSIPGLNVGVNMTSAL